MMEQLLTRMTRGQARPVSTTRARKILKSALVILLILVMVVIARELFVRWLHNLTSLRGHMDYPFKN
jgi:hypothetical protein